MDLKKVDVKGIWGFIDGLARKVPDSIASIIKKVLIGILAIIVIIAISYGWGLGKNTAKEEGQSLAKDSRSMFQEDIEKEYNRKRKNIIMPDMFTPMEEIKTNIEKNYEYMKRENSIREGKIEAEKTDILENEKGYRIPKRESGYPVIAETEDGYVPAQFESDIPGLKVPEHNNRPLPGGGGDQNNNDLIQPGGRKKLQIEKNKGNLNPAGPRDSVSPTTEKTIIEDSTYIRKKNPDDAETETSNRSKTRMKRKLIKPNQ